MRVGTKRRRWRRLQRALLDAVNAQLAYDMRQLISDSQQTLLLAGQFEIADAIKTATQGGRHDT